MAERIEFPTVLGGVDQLELSRAVHWIDCRLVPGRVYRLRAIIDGDPETADRAALACFDQAEAGEGLSTSASVGAYVYLRTGPGLHRTDRFIGVGGEGAGRVGVMAWGNRGPARLRLLTIEEVQQRTGAASFFFSFDVEAAAERAASDPIDTLVWGRIGGEELGIRRICEVLESYGIVGNFLVDLATCTFEGERPMREIVEFLVGRNHEVHMHLHPEWLARQWGLSIQSGKSIHLDSTGFDMSRQLLDFTVAKFDEFTGQPPRLFRSGAYRMSTQMVLAAGALGIEALSNVRAGTLESPYAGGDEVDALEPFVWENGLLEIPVDASSPEAGKFQNYLQKFDIAMRRKQVEPTFNVVMHSWSLMRRNEAGVHDAFEPEFEKRLHEMCQHASENGKAYGYSHYLDTTKPLRHTVTLDQVRQGELSDSIYIRTEDVVTCHVCAAIYSAAGRPACPNCGAEAASRRLKSVINDYGNFFAGRRIVACGLSHAQRRVFFPAGSDILAVDDWRGLAEVADDSQHCVVSLNRLGPDALVEAARVLAPGGVLVLARGESVPSGFTVSSIPALDPIEGTTGRVILARRA